MSPPVRTALRLIRRLTLEPDSFGADDIGAARRGGLGEDDILDAVQVCVAFNTIDRIADAVAFAVPPEEHLEFGARMIRRMGYGLPGVIGPLMRER